jgi:hypothetical protein
LVEKGIPRFRIGHLPWRLIGTSYLVRRPSDRPSERCTPIESTASIGLGWPLEIVAYCGFPLFSRKPKSRAFFMP